MRVRPMPNQKRYLCPNWFLCRVKSPKANSWFTTHGGHCPHSKPHTFEEIAWVNGRWRCDASTCQFYDVHCEEVNTDGDRGQDIGVSP